MSIEDILERFRCTQRLVDGKPSIEIWSGNYRLTEISWDGNLWTGRIIGHEIQRTTLSAALENVAGLVDMFLTKPPELSKSKAPSDSLPVAATLRMFSAFDGQR